MIFNLNPNGGVPLYRQIAQQLRGRIVSGQIASGEQIPSARELSTQLKVNPLTIQKVYQILEHEGLVETRRGLGTFVVEGAKNNSAKEKLALLHPSIHQLISEAIPLGIDAETLTQEIERHFKHSKLSQHRERKS
ncbi:MAG: GntR family transcriptional regulator [Verrucomicrobiota bacterium]